MTTATQPKQALAGAQKRRLAQYRFRLELSKLAYPEGCAIAADVLESGSDEHLEALPVLKLLGWIHRVGEHAARGLMTRAGVLRKDPLTRVSELTERERKCLSVELRSKGD